MCSSSIVSGALSAVSKPLGRGVSNTLGRVPVVGDQVSSGLSRGLDVAQMATQDIPVLREATQIGNETLTGTNVNDTRNEIQNQINYASENLETIGAAPDPFNFENEEEYLSALRARYRDDARSRRYRGRAGTILTGGQGAQGASGVVSPQLTGRQLRFF